jgi:hypothetical protein
MTITQGGVRGWESGSIANNQTTYNGFGNNPPSGGNPYATTLDDLLVLQVWCMDIAGGLNLLKPTSVTDNLGDVWTEVSGGQVGTDVMRSVWTAPALGGSLTSLTVTPAGTADKYYYWLSSFNGSVDTPTVSALGRTAGSLATDYPTGYIIVSGSSRGTDAADYYMESTYDEIIEDWTGTVRVASVFVRNLGAVSAGTHTATFTDPYTAEVGAEYIFLEEVAAPPAAGPTGIAPQLRLLKVTAEELPYQLHTRML